MQFALLEWCLQAPLATSEMDSADGWLACWQQLPFADASAMQLAVQGGFQADRAAWAFASGYQAALRAQFPSADGDGLYAFCLTEQGVRSSRQLQSRWWQTETGVALQGSKGWAPLFEQCRAFYVACRSADGAAPDEQEPGGFRILRVATTANGVTFTPREPGSFMPELPTARMQLDGVMLGADALLPCDGWHAYANPFSVQEELYVSAALLAYLLREGRSNNWPVSYLQQLLAALALLAELAGSDGKAAISRVVLTGATAWARQLFNEANALWAVAPDDARAQRWLRDQPIQTLWAGSSAQRGAKAWQAVCAQVRS
ncbi:acyl-CoA dehydrogenase family protein [Halopseudomonas sabulinigri]|uniref:Acyl-CoA dehydrogenase family protein n=1 Tax=Halopseudomonas sabulinigri TaxID=472181 RepID=A0ABP9ZQE3_9GAMM